MKQCMSCGAVLPEGEQNVCLVCGTRQTETTNHARQQSPATAAQSGVHRASGTQHADSHAQHTDTRHATRSAQILRPAPAEQALHTTRAAAHEKGDDTQVLGVPTQSTRRRPDNLLRMLAMVLVAMVVLLVVGAGLTYFMYDRFNASDAYSSLGNALLTADLPVLRELVQGDGVSVTDEGLTALCRAFSTQESVDRLLEQLKQQTAGAAAEHPYPALSLSSDPVFLGYKNHKLTAKPVSLQISTTTQNILLSIDGASRTGEPSEGGALYQGMFPGVYTCVVTGQTAMGETVTGAATDLALFDLTAPVIFDGALPIADITIAGCISDEAMIAINGTDVAQKPSGTVVSLPQVAVGSTITMRYTAPYGALTTASVQFADRAQPQLSFTAHVTEGGVPPEEDVKSLFGAFFASYLDALNNADAARITTCTEAMRSKLAGDVDKDETKANVYQFTEAQASTKTVEQAFLEDGTATLKVNAQVAYKTTKRASDKDKKDDSEASKKETVHTVYYAVEFAHVDGSWKVNRLAETTKDNFDGGILVPIEG